MQNCHKNRILWYNNRPLFVVVDTANSRMVSIKFDG